MVIATGVAPAQAKSGDQPPRDQLHQAAGRRGAQRRKPKDHPAQHENGFASPAVAQQAKHHRTECQTGKTGGEHGAQHRAGNTQRV